MPELPDLEIFKDNIFSKLILKKLIDVKVFHPMKVNMPQQLLSEELVGRELLSINRIGKEMFFDFADSHVISVHLMLNGETSIVSPSSVDEIKFKILSLNFEQQTVVFSDRGGLCTIKYRPIVNGVPDAFDQEFTLEYFLSKARKKALTNIKAFLIDQHIVKGIGNAYADEILWTARISPKVLVGRIPQERMADLYHAINPVLKEAIRSIKSICPDIISGEERSFLKVHNKNRKETETGFPIKVERIASKITYFTDEQIFYP